MNIYLIVFIGLIVLVGLWIMATYNFFVSSKARIKAAIQEIGNQLKRQADLIPNLESSAKGFLKQEKGIFDALANARKAVSEAIKSNDINKMSKASDMVSNVLPNINVAVESNPEIKSNEVITKLMNELRDTSDKIMYSRRLLIDLTADFNVKRVTFPSSLVANLFKIEEQKGLETPTEGEHLEVSKEEMKSPKVNL